MDNSRKLIQMTDSKAFGAAIDETSPTLHFGFIGNVDSEETEIKVDLPISALKLIAAYLIQCGMEYEAKNNVDIGFGNGGVEDDD